LNSKGDSRRVVRSGITEVGIELNYEGEIPVSALLVADAGNSQVLGIAKSVSGPWADEDEAFADLEPKAKDWAQQLESGR
jgi:hypothetical protein